MIIAIIYLIFSGIAECAFLVMYMAIHISRSKRYRQRIATVSHLERKYSKSIQDQSTKCSICLKDFHFNDDIVVLPCNSSYIYKYINL